MIEFPNSHTEINKQWKTCTDLLQLTHSQWNGINNINMDNTKTLSLWVQITLMKRCSWYNIMWWSLSVTCRRSVVFSGYSGFLRHDITEILLKVALNTITHHPSTKTGSVTSGIFCYFSTRFLEPSLHNLKIIYNHWLFLSSVLGALITCLKIHVIFYFTALFLKPTLHIKELYSILYYFRVLFPELTQHTYLRHICNLLLFQSFVHGTYLTYVRWTYKSFRSKCCYLAWQVRLTLILIVETPVIFYTWVTCAL